MIKGFRVKNSIKALLVFGALSIFVASCLQPSAKVPPTITSSETPEPVPQRVSDATFKDFSHSIEEHKQFECNSCHRREGKSLDMEFAAHESCVGCHLNQFTSSEPAMCAICHNDLKPIPPTMNTFPAKFVEGFNMKFDHADHDSGEGRPAQGCVSCHAPAGGGKSIPAGFQAHNNCYTCHTAESKIGSCNTCHELKPYSRTSPRRTAFRGSFSHNDHGRVGCADCHSVLAGAPQGRQVTDIAVSQHCGGTNNCATCHNGSRAFGDGNFADLTSCARCHTGSGFDMMAGDPCRK
ncbi:MAG: cytochrome c3 family protein [Pyrinomonadaceae bacterium]